MPVSKIKPEETYIFFHTREKMTHVAKRLGTTKDTLKKWWVAEFGEEAYEKRKRSCKLTSEEKNERRRERAKLNSEKIRIQRQAWYAQNKEKIKIRQKQHRDNNKEHYRKYNKEYYRKHAEEFRKRASNYRAENKERINARDKKYFSANPEVLLHRLARQRARRYGVPFDLTRDYVKTIIPEDNHCPITREEFQRGEGEVTSTSMTLDRIVPELGYVKGNVAVISHLANTMKQNCTNPQVFLRLAEYVSKNESR